MDVHDDLDVFLRTETQRNKYLAVSIINETASLLLHAAISYSHADSVMIKLVTIQWTGIFTTTNYFTVHTFPAEGSGMLMHLLCQQNFKDFILTSNYQYQLSMTFYLEIAVCAAAMDLCLPCEMNCFSVIELSNWSFYFQWDTWLLVYQFCIIRTKEHTCICILGQPFLSYDVLIVRTQKSVTKKKETIILCLLCGAAICRKSVVEMMCMLCLNVQPVGPNCQSPSCNGLSMAKYYCSICKFFDDER